MKHIIKRKHDAEFRLEGTFDEIKRYFEPTAENRAEMNDFYADLLFDFDSATDVEDLIGITNKIDDAGMDYYIDSTINNIITAQEAAVLLGISERGVRWNCENGKYQARKAGKVWLIDRDSLGL